MKINIVLFGGIALASGLAAYYYFNRNKKKNSSVPYDMGPSIADPDPFSTLALENQMPTRPVTDDWVQDYNRFINGYREDPTMFPENYYDLPFRYEGPSKGILTSPGIPHPFFGANPLNPEPNWHNNWIRQPFSF